MIRYIFQDPISKKYLNTFFSSAEKALSYKASMLDIHNPKKWCKGSKYYFKYNKITSYYKRLVLKKAKIKLELCNIGATTCT